jgi:hypothetical protein
MMRHVFCGNDLVSYKEKDFSTIRKSRKLKSAPRISRMIFRLERLRRAVGISRIKHQRVASDPVTPAPAGPVRWPKRGNPKSRKWTNFMWFDAKWNCTRKHKRTIRKEFMDGWLW